jgi:hypothetical protein
MKKKNELPERKAPTGRYVYDAALGRVVKISDQVPGLKKGPSSFEGCPVRAGGHKCGGGCGCGG